MFLNVIIFILGFLLIEAKVFDDLSSLDFDIDLHKRTGSDDIGDDLSLLTNLISKVSKQNFNISVSAWQNIYDYQNNIKAINTIELLFPVKDPLNVIYDDLKNEDLSERADQHKIIRNIKPFTDLIDQGFFVNVAVEQWNKRGEDDVLFYWDKETTFFRVDGLVSFNKTKVATKEEIDKFLEQLENEKQRKGDFSLQTLFMTFDQFPIIKINQSTIKTPSVVAYVIDFKEASDEIIIESPLLLTQIFLTTETEQIPEQLAKKFDARFPTYEWNVVVNIGGSYIKKDVCVQLSLDGFEFFDEEKPIYTVYGISKKQ